MKVYVVQTELTGMLGGDGDSHIQEVRAVRTKLESAQALAHKRAGKALMWEYHNAHGPSWVTKYEYRINSGPLLTIHYWITEHDLED